MNTAKNGVFNELKHSHFYYVVDEPLLAGVYLRNIFWWGGGNEHNFGRWEPPPFPQLVKTFNLDPMWHKISKFYIHHSL